MKYRNPVYADNSGDFVDMEINHEEYGWIPHTADQNMIMNDPELGMFLAENPPAPYQE